MLKKIRQHVITQLWEIYREQSAQIALIENKLCSKQFKMLTLDHFAVIDLPSSHSGVSVMSQIFKALGFIERGKDYLPDKQNDFLWLTENDYAHLPAKDILPQIVVADFRMNAMPESIQHIIKKYVAFAKPFNFTHFQVLLNEAIHENKTAMKELISLITAYFSGRDWPLPTLAEFNIVREFNELLAWVLIFGRQPNHFTFAIHLSKDFKSLANFLKFITDDVQLSLNDEGGLIKGGEKVGIAQASTNGMMIKISLVDGEIELPKTFVEFVWRYAIQSEPFYWKDYFPDFIAHHANYVIESLYV